MKLKLNILAIALALAFMASAETETVDGMTYTFTIVDGKATITKAEGDNTVVDIPSTLGGATVTRLSESSFADNSLVVKVIIPETVTTIGANAFRMCESMSICILPTGLTGLSDNTFEGCKSLRSVALPAGLKSIGSLSFAYCSSLATIELPDGLTSISHSAFNSCISLKKIVIPDSVTLLGEEYAGAVFFGCSSLASVRLPSGLTKISSRTFYGCSSLVEISIPNKVASIGYGCFSGCSSLKELIVPASVVSVGESAFGATSCKIVFCGNVPAGASKSGFANAECVKEKGSQYQSVVALRNFAGYYQTNAPTVTIVSSGIRSGEPTILDVKYKVASSKNTVKVRALAFKDGVRSLANVVVPKSFVADADGNATSGNVGDSVTANEEHTLSWKVSEDWQETLANVAFEVLAVEDDILPLELTTIPGTTDHPATIQVSWNYVTGDRVFDALLWLYADGDLGITVTDGVMKHGDQTIASGTGNTGYDALVYVYSKMGYSLLQGDELTYAKNALRLDLPDISTRQYAYKVISEK